MAGLSDPYAILRVGPQTFTSKHVDNTHSPKWEEIYEVRRRMESKLEMCVVIAQVSRDSIICHFTLFCIWGIRLLQRWECSFSFTVAWGQLPYKSLCQSSCPCVCLVHQVIVHEVPGQELEVEVYDKDTDQDDFLGRYICIFMSLVCLHWISHCHFSSLTFPSQLGKSILPFFFFEAFGKLQHRLSMLWSFYFKQYIFFFNWILSYTPPPFRAKLDLGIVKKSIVVDNVSIKSCCRLSHSLYKYFCNLLIVSACLCLSSQWLTLKETTSGRVHFRLEWLALLPSTDRLEQVWVTHFHWCITNIFPIHSR